MRSALAALLLAWSALATAGTWRFAVLGDAPYSRHERQEFPGMLEVIADGMLA